MPRRTLDRYPITPPTEAAIARYYHLFDGYTLHHCPDALPALSSPDLFGNARPLLLDIGCGRGEFALRYAQAHPDWNALGLDFHRKGLYDAVNQAQILRIPNVHFVKADARHAMRKVPAASVAAITLLFPAPVTQRKHRKKDLLTADFIAALAAALVPCGTLAFVTNHRAYFDCKVELLDHRLERIGRAEGFEGGLTRFQRIWERHGLPSLRAEYRQLANA
jgi:tRNA (guanine-N7-)-methyltransferase